MPTKIRLMRIGAKKRPFYRVVAVDERKKRTGSYIELLGTYNPLTEPKEIKLKKDRIDWWIERGAVPSDGYLRMTKQAPQKPPRPPKKDRTKSQEIKSQPKEVKLVQAEESISTEELPPKTDEKVEEITEKPVVENSEVAAEVESETKKEGTTA